MSEAIRNGAAPDGGLYLPYEVPVTGLSRLRGSMTLPEFAVAMLTPFFEGDALAADLDAICGQAFNFPIKMVTPDKNKSGLRALELFHGPTGAFKDFGARFLMGCFDRLGEPGSPLTVLAATSGDTGGAVGCAAEGREAVRAFILYPKGRVSPFQELQLTCWRKPVRALEVEGDFDDCQRLAKAAFSDAALSRAHNLTSANSINIGRLLPQMAYLAWAATTLFEKKGEKPGFIIPTGNLGHAFAAVYARAMGFPIGPVVAATNANPTLGEWRRSGIYEPRPALTTIANAMDVGDPSNFERLMHLPPEQRMLDIAMVGDDAIRARIKAEYEASSYIWCPHSAIGAEAYARLDERRREERPWIVAATAHPFKFADIIEPVIGETLAPPPALAAILGRKTSKSGIAAKLDALASAL